MLDEFSRAQRRLHIGSSDAAAVCGKDPWRGPADVWAEKTGRTPGFQGNAATEVGQFLEHGVLAWAESQLNTTLTRDLSRTHPNGIAAANFDGLALGLSEPADVEAKVIGVLHRPHYLDEFGAAGTDEVPAHILIQVHHQLAVLAGQDDLPPIRVVHIPVLLGGRGFVMYRVQRNDELVAAILDREAQFWRDYVQTGVCPPDTLPTLDTLKAWHRLPETETSIDYALVDAWQQAQAAEREAKKATDLAQRAMLTALGDAEAAHAGDGMLVYREQTRKGFTTTDTTFRVAKYIPNEKTKGRRAA